MPPTVIALANQKGGVSKTTTAVNLGAALAAAGYQTAVIDFDPQANATMALGVDPLAVPHTTYDLMMDPDRAVTEVLYPTDYAITLVPSHINLSLAEQELQNRMNRERVLQRRLQDLPADLDFVLIDCPPTLGILTINALTASDWVLVPLQTEPFAVEGLRALLNTIKLVQTETNPGLRLMGILLTLTDPEHSVSRNIEANTRQTFGSRVFQTTIPRYKRLTEVGVGGPLRSWAPTHPAVALYASLAEEVIARAAI